MRKTDEPKKWRAVSHLNHAFLVSPNNQAFYRFSICEAQQDAESNNALNEVERLAEEGKL